jgi:site-specific recombinase XerD
MHELLSRYKRDLALRGYSERTCRHYFANANQFLVHYDLPIDRIGSEKIKDYLYYLITDKKASDSKIRQALKHKALLTLVYSSGLRVSESVHVKLSDIKRDRRKLLVRQGKGAKDRYTILSDLCLNLLDTYWRKYRPDDWLFPGRDGKSSLSARACQHAFYIAKERAGIKIEGGVHTLRHSFATHFLESGGGIFQLQMLLGHKNIKTTLVYAHVQEENIITRSPLDVYGKGESFDR